MRNYYTYKNKYKPYNNPKMETIQLNNDYVTDRMNSIKESMKYLLENRENIETTIEIQNIITDKLLDFDREMIRRIVYDMGYDVNMNTSNIIILLIFKYEIYLDVISKTQHEFNYRDIFSEITYFIYVLKTILNISDSYKLIEWDNLNAEYETNVPIPFFISYMKPEKWEQLKENLINSVGPKYVLK